MNGMAVVAWSAAIGLPVIIAAWIAESHKNGNRFWVWVRAGLEAGADCIYDHCYLAIWRAMMRHAADPAYKYHGRHAK